MKMSDKQLKETLIIYNVNFETMQVLQIHCVVRLAVKKVHLGLSRILRDFV